MARISCISLDPSNHRPYCFCFLLLFPSELLLDLRLIIDERSLTVAVLRDAAADCPPAPRKLLSIASASFCFSWRLVSSSTLED